MQSQEFEQAVERYHRAVGALVQGDTEPQKLMFSRRDDVTLANPLGPPVRGWEAVSKALDNAASAIKGGEPIQVERISGYATAELGYVLEIERTRIGVDDSGERRPIALRVTTVLRNENGEWRVIHRHADPITTPRSIESALQQPATGEPGGVR